MGISRQTLEQWKRRGDDGQCQHTYEVMCDLLKRYCADIINVDSDRVFLQGSYANHTNIKDNSDIDIVVMHKTVFGNNAREVLNESQLREFNVKYSDSDLTINSFKEQIYERLNGKYFDGKYIILEKGCKTIKFNQDNTHWSLVPVDFVPALEYRYYHKNNGINKDNQTEGIKIYDTCKNEHHINYPKLHKKNGEEKNQPNRTAGYYKETIRVFKRIRTHLIELKVIAEELVPSYGLECMLYNVPDSFFRLDIVERIPRIINWFSNNINDKFEEQNGMYYLFRKSWNIQDSKIFIDKCIWLFNN
ncbi:MAG: nucleotidyltransferase [Candidatus Cloacimonetes bacterium]|nr:nucleotidyltransferase [Candidatus Cloacimonadota bacterium]